MGRAHFWPPVELLARHQDELQVPVGPASGLDRPQRLGDLAGAELAGRALPARLHEQEPRVAVGRLDHAGRVVEHGEPGRSEARSQLPHRVEVHRHIQLLRSDDGVGGAGEDGLHRPALGRAAAQLLHQVPQGRAERKLEHPLSPHVPADGEDHRAGSVLGAVRPQPVGAVGKDVGHVGQRLDVVDQRRVVLGRPGEQPLDVRAGHPRQRRAPLDHLLHPGLLPEQVQIRAEDDLHRNASERVRCPASPRAPGSGPGTPG